MTEELLELVEQRNFGKVRPILLGMQPVDIAAVFADLPENSLSIVFRILPKELAAEVFVEMDSDMQEILIRSFSDKELKYIVDELFLDDTVDIIEEMPANVVKRIIAQSDASTRMAINEILKYPEDSAGTLMTIEYVDLKTTMSVKEAFARIRRTGVDKETIYTCYATDQGRHLLGTVSVRALLLADPEEKIGEIMNTNIIYVTTATDKEEVANVISKYDLLAVPVVDAETRLVGIITVDDAVDVIQEEATEDISKMAAMTPNDKPYLKTGVFRLWLNRVPWLLLLMISATFTGMIIEQNEATLAFSITLTACIPMLMDTGGNAGSQASVTIIRSLALNEVGFADFFKVVWKELRVSVLLGLTLAAACFAKLMLVNGLYDNIPVALVICLSMFVTIVLAKIVGCSLPLIAKKCHLDPAVVASPFITTIVDAFSLIIYCNIAIALLG